MQKTYNTVRRVMGDSTGYDQGTEFPVIISEKRVRTYHVFVDNTLESPQEMRWAVQALSEANEDDEVIFHVNSHGGSVDSLQRLLHAKNNTKAYTHTIATGTCASCAAMFLADSDSYELDPMCGVLFHSIAFGHSGKTQDMVEISEFLHEQGKRLLTYYTIGVLTPEEIHEILKNKQEHWLHAKDFDERMRRKARCRKLVLEMVKDQGINPEEAGTELYVDLMTLALKIDAEEQAEKQKKPAKRTRAKKAAPSCCGEETCKE